MMRSFKWIAVIIAVLTLPVLGWTGIGGDDPDAPEDYPIIAEAAEGEFQANTYTTDFQGDPCVAVSNLGNFVVVWESEQEGGDNRGIYGQLFDSAGAAVGEEFHINTYTTSSQADPIVAMDTDGDFVVVWNSYDQDGSGWGIYAQRYDSAGLPAGAEFPVNQTTDYSQWLASVDMDDAGNFTVAWQSEEQDGNGYGVVGRMFNADGAAFTDEFVVNTYTDANQWRPSLACDANGNFVVAWVSQEQDGSGDGVFAQRFDNTGAAVDAEFQVNTTTDGAQSMRWGRSAAMDDAGSFAVVWESADSDGKGVFGQVFSSDGVPVGGEFQINTYPTGDQANPAVAMDAGGGFIVAWQSYMQDGDDQGDYGQKFDPTGALLGDEFSLNVFTTDGQWFPRLSMDAAGNYVAVWQSENQDGDYFGVFGRISECQLDEDCDDGNDCTDDVCNGSLCEHDDNDGPCDDGVFCNGDDSCSEGACTIHAGDPCPDDTLWCNGLESCDEEGDVCAHEYNDTDNPRCLDDSTFCNGDEVCNEDDNVCGHSGNPCPDDGQYCTGVESCDETEDECLASGDPCIDDGSWCNGNEYCDEDENTCAHEYNDEDNPRCEDNDVFCDGVESCDEGGDACVSSGDPCNDDGYFCNGDESCDEDNDQCISSGDPCGDDSVYCNGLESCDENIDDCVHSGTPCPDDGVFCNGDESCDETDDICESSGDPCGDDGVYCNGLESCNETDDICESSGDPCVDDGLFCNGDESCDEDGDQCISSGDPCGDDGQYCNGIESCNETDDACESSGDPCVDDGVYCNGDEFCDEDNDACDTTGNPCPDDELFCTGIEGCDEENTQCTSSGDPCLEGETCDEENDQCNTAGDDDVADDDTAGDDDTADADADGDDDDDDDSSGGCCG